MIIKRWMIKKLVLKDYNSSNLLRLKNFCLFENLKKDSEKVEPELPANCCMSGCANCVWLDYAENLLKHYGKLDKNNLQKAISEIEKLNDENLKNFLLMEIKFKLK